MAPSRCIDSNLRPVAQYLLEGLAAADEERVASVALIGHRWIVNSPARFGWRLANLSGPNAVILAYDLPGVTAAQHGWVSLGGGPMRQNTPQ